jgi:hypothetical protein
LIFEIYFEILSIIDIDSLGDGYNPKYQSPFEILSTSKAIKLAIIPITCIQNS